jgi:hypothetical protein
MLLFIQKHRINGKKSRAISWEYFINSIQFDSINKNQTNIFHDFIRYFTQKEIKPVSLIFPTMKNE